MTIFKRQIVELLGLQFPLVSAPAAGDATGSNAVHGPLCKVGIPNENQSVFVENSFIKEGSVILGVVINGASQTGFEYGEVTGAGEAVIAVSKPAYGTAWVVYLVLNPSESAEIATGEGMDDAFKIEDEIVLANGRGHFAAHIDCPGPWLAVGNGDTEITGQAAFEIFPNSISQSRPFTIQQNGDTVTRGDLDVYGDFTDH